MERSTPPQTLFFHPPTLTWMQDWLRNKKSMRESRPRPAMLQELQRSLDKNPDAVLVSAYLSHYQMCNEIGKMAKQRNIPMLLGGPFFNLSKVTREWMSIEGVTAIVGAEVDRSLPAILKDLLAGNKLHQHPGVFTKGRDMNEVIIAKPLQRLSELPNPDFSDFPWHKYPHPIIPIMSGRGCSWGACTFCGDVISANGRTFRSRGIDAVLKECQEQSKKQQSKDFMFLDIKLNSDLEVWRGLIDKFQDSVPGARWIGTVHVNHKGEHGLSREELFAAKQAGLTRISFGLESGSQRLLDKMCKGTKIEECGQFIQDAYDAGISIRTSMMLGYPGETTEDVEQTIIFMEANEKYLDRVRLSKFKPLPETPFDRIYKKAPERMPNLSLFKWDYQLARGLYRYHPPKARAYRKAKNQLLNIVHRINSKALRDDAKEFNGMM